MRLLLDHNISPKVAAPLQAAGHDVVVLRDLGLAHASDNVVLETGTR